MATIDHTACTHPRTPAGRAACRKLRAGLAATTPAVGGIKMTGDVARRMARTAAKVENAQRELLAKVQRRAAISQAIIRQDNARIQPRRSGARVAVDSSTCVQAALHTSRGLCACGHMTGEFRVAA
jgi:hypothetical protein